MGKPQCGCWPFSLFWTDQCAEDWMKVTTILEGQRPLTATGVFSSFLCIFIFLVYSVCVLLSLQEWVCLCEQLITCVYFTSSMICCSWSLVFLLPILESSSLAGTCMCASKYLRGILCLFWVKSSAEVKDKTNAQSPDRNKGDKKGLKPPR